MLAAVIEDALIHEIGLPFDREEQPLEVVQLEHSETIGLGRDGPFDVLCMLVEALFPSGDDLRKTAGIRIRNGTRLIHRPYGDIVPPVGGIHVFSCRFLL